MEIFFWQWIAPVLGGFIAERICHFTIVIYREWRKARQDARFKITLDREQAAYLAYTKRAK